MEKGFTILKKAFPPKSVGMFTLVLDTILLIAKPENIVRDSSGSIIQVNNLQDRVEFKILLEHVRYNLGYAGEVLNMQYLVKKSNSKGTKPHQDGFEYPEDDIMTIWIPLQKVDEDNSTIQYLKWDGDETLVEHKSDGNKSYQSFCEGYENAEFTPVSLNKGDCVIHNKYIIHSTTDNNTDNNRVSIVITLKNEG